MAARDRSPPGTTSDETNSTLGIVANDATAAEASRYRCVVKMPFDTAIYTRTTNEVSTLALRANQPAASNIDPTRPLAGSGIGDVVDCRHVQRVYRAGAKGGRRLRSQTPKEFTPRA
ncbi:MAG: hypothetical protein ACLT98_14875 [Eggerthellaceae bacterium]